MPIIRRPCPDYKCRLPDREVATRRGRNVQMPKSFYRGLLFLAFALAGAIPTVAPAQITRTCESCITEFDANTMKSTRICKPVKCSDNPFGVIAKPPVRAIPPAKLERPPR
jgi:hypothetical protein